MGSHDSDGTGRMPSSLLIGISFMESEVPGPDGVKTWVLKLTREFPTILDSFLPV